MKLFTPLIQFTILFSLLSFSTAQANPATPPILAESQQKFVKQYKKQNPPKPEEMLINTDPEPSLEEGFTSLYKDGDLSDWVQHGGAHTFEAKEGLIEGSCVRGQVSAYLCTKKDFKDFILTTEIQWLEDMNTGLLIRSKVRPSKTKKGKEISEAYGPQIEMEGFAKPDRGWSGGLYRQGCGGWTYPLWLEQHTEARIALKKDQWNRVTIKAKGDSIKTWINGVPAANWIDPEFFEGFIGLQVHSGKGGKVQFRNIHIKELHPNSK